MYIGTLNKAAIISKPYLVINNNKPKWRIINYDLTYYTKGAKGGLHIFTLSKDTISGEAFTCLDSIQNGAKIYVDNIKAVNKFNDTCYLNPIVIKIKEKKIQ